MAEVITRSIPAIPYNGGTLRTAQPYSAAVQLTPTRMIWTYCQSAPDWRYFVVVDTPEGWANGGTPTVTVSRMQDQKTYRGLSLQMVRLNDNAFMIMDLQAVTSVSWSYEVFEINADNVFTRTATNLDPYDVVQTSISNSTGYLNSAQTGTNAKYTNVATLVPLADNQFLFAGFNNTSVVSVSGVCTYNTTTKVVTFNNGNLVSLGSFGNAGSANSAEVYWRSIPNSTKKAITFKTANTLAAWNGTVMQFQTLVVNADGTIAANYPRFENALGNSLVTQAQDMAMMSDTRMARTSWTWNYYYGLSGGTTSSTGTATNDGFGSFTSTQSPNPQLAFPMDANYVMLWDRTHFASATSGNIKIKITRRDDANMASQSPGSAISATGFEVTAPWIQTWYNDSRPRMLPNGDVFWWGLDASGKLAWNILKNAS